jgi:hypothetical protein
VPWRLPPEWRVVNTIPLSVNVAAGMACRATVWRNASTTTGPVTRRCAVTDNA